MYILKSTNKFHDDEQVKTLGDLNSLSLYLTKPAKEAMARGVGLSDLFDSCPGGLVARNCVCDYYIYPQNNLEHV